MNDNESASGNLPGMQLHGALQMMALDLILPILYVLAAFVLVCLALSLVDLFLLCWKEYKNFHQSPTPKSQTQRSRRHAWLPFARFGNGKQLTKGD
ncbi:MAG TPA: hypothetical protein VFZ34_11165 [Blastocatellia bacterium]|nr:hypothetical protein [Blastocatellia bacterium]